MATWTRPARASLTLARFCNSCDQRSERMVASRADDNISFVSAVYGVYESYVGYCVQYWNDGIKLPEDIYSDWLKYGEYGQREIYYTCILAIFLTVLRYFMAFAVFEPIAKHFKLLPLNQSKFPESAWKVSYYLFIAGIEFYLLVWPGQYDYFWKPYYVWRDWAPGQLVAGDIYFIYMVHSGFYLHSIYASLYMDHWRKDGGVMIFHHILTLTLLVSSYASRYHKIGIVLLFIHDVSDIFLEGTKCNVYFKDRGGKHYKLHETLATIGFLMFTVVWYIGRLYYFPLKVLFSSSVAVKFYADRMEPDMHFPFFLFFNTLMLSLLILNLYWFAFILSFLYKVATGQMKEVDDVREEEVQERIRQTNHAKLLHKQNGASKPYTNGVQKRKVGCQGDE